MPKPHRTRFFTLGEMAGELGVSKSYVSRRARSDKDVKGVPVHRWTRLYGGKIDGFEVPMRKLNDEGGLTPERRPRNRSRSRLAGSDPKASHSSETGHSPETSPSEGDASKEESPQGARSVTAANFQPKRENREPAQKRSATNKEATSDQKGGADEEGGENDKGGKQSGGGWMRAGAVVLGAGALAALLGD